MEKAAKIREISVLKITCLGYNFKRKQVMTVLKPKAMINTVKAVVLLVKQKAAGNK